MFDHTQRLHTGQHMSSNSNNEPEVNFWLNSHITGPNRGYVKLQRDVRKMSCYTCESYWGVLCGANLWFGGFPYPVNPGRPEWSKVQTRGKPLVATAQATCVSAGE